MMRAEAHDVPIDVEQVEVDLVEVDHAHELSGELRLRAVDMGIVHLHGTNAHQPEKLAALFIAVAGAVLRQAHGQLAIAAQLGAEDLVVHGAVHRLYIVGDPFHLHRRVHAVLVKVEVTAAQEQVLLSQMGRAHALIAGGLFGLFSQAFQLFDDDGAARQP